VHEILLLKTVTCVLIT